MKFRLLRMAKSDHYIHGHVVKKGQFVGVDWNGCPIIVSDYINRFNTIPIYIFDRNSKQWYTKYYPIDSPLLPIDFTQRLWVKQMRMKGRVKYDTSICMQ